MAIIHTIKLDKASKRNKGVVTAKRTSQSRTYGACLVVTTTDASVADDQRRKAETLAKLLKAETLRDALLAALGMTVEQARALCKEASDRWYNNEDGFFATNKRIRTERTGSPRGYVSGLDNLSKADLLARGFVDPYADGGPNSLIATHNVVECLTDALATWQDMEAGGQSVISWHRDVSLANKAVGGREARYFTSRGDTVVVRTDIDVRETKKRAKK